MYSVDSYCNCYGATTVKPLWRHIFLIFPSEILLEGKSECKDSETGLRAWRVHMGVCGL